LEPTPTSNKPETLFTIRTAIILIFYLLISGCAALRSNPETASGVAAIDKDGNHYYHYIRSELEGLQDHADQAIMHMERAVAAQPESVFLKKELIYLYLQTEQTDKALQTIETILHDHPDDIGALIIAGTIKKQTGNDEEAAAIFEKVLSLNPEHENIYHVLGEYYLEKNALEQASVVYERMTARFPDVWEGFFFLGKIQARQGKFAEAEKNFQHCLALEKKLISPRFELIELYKKQSAAAVEITVQPGDTLYSLCQKHYRAYNDEVVKKIAAANPAIADIKSLIAGQRLLLPEAKAINEAEGRKKIIALYHSILTDYPDNYRTVMDLALYHLANGNRQEGERLLSDLGHRTADPASNQMLIQQISQFYISQRRYDEAQTILLGLLKGTSADSDLNYLLGMIYNKQKKAAAALDHFSRIQDGSPFYTAALLQSAFLYEETQQPEKARATFNLLLEKEPDSVELLLYAASFLERTEKYAEAETLLRRGIAIDPQNVDLLFRLGVVFDKTGQKEALIDQMKSIIEIAPDDANALNYLGYTYAEMGIRLDEAQQLIEKALRVEPDNGYITDSLGWVFYQKGELDKAIEFLNRAVELTPDDAILLEHLGDAYLKNGETGKALEAYQRSLQFAPEKDREKITKKIQALLPPIETP